MRLLIDEHKFSWDDAFEVTCQVFSYTNHADERSAGNPGLVDMLGKILRAICRSSLKLTTTSQDAAGAVSERYWPAEPRFYH